MIDDMRSLIDRISPDDKQYGLPYSVIKKNKITLTPNTPGNTLKNLYLLEFHPWLAAASRVPDAIQVALEVNEIYLFFNYLLFS